MIFDLEKIKEAIDESVFISMDLEFTGITSRNSTFFDTMQQRYLGTRHSATSHAINQFGFTCWKLTEEIWKPTVFCFYVKPNSGVTFSSSSGRNLYDNYL